MRTIRHPPIKRPEQEFTFQFGQLVDVIEIAKQVIEHNADNKTVNKIWTLWPLERPTLAVYLGRRELYDLKISPHKTGNPPMQARLWTHVGALICFKGYNPQKVFFSSIRPIKK